MKPAHSGGDAERPKVGSENGETFGSPMSSHGGKGQGPVRAWVARTTPWVVAQLLSRRVWILALLHTAVFSAVYLAAFELRFDFRIPTEYWRLFWATLPWVLGVKLAVFYWLGQFHGWWHYVTFGDLVALSRAAVLSLLAIAVLDHFLIPGQIPRSALILDCIVGILILGGLRASTRLFREQVRPIFHRNGYRSALLVGADYSSAILAYQIQSHFHLPYRIRGFLATDNVQKGARLGQIPVLGHLEDLFEIAAAYRIADVLVTAGSLPGRQFRELMDTCTKAGLNLKIIRSAEDRLNGDNRVPIRDIEISDLLQREPVELDTQSIGELLEGRTIMVTGAGGSIGSEICRQLMKFEPKSLVLVGRGENRIFAIERELRSLGSLTELHACIGDVTDEDRMRCLFERHRPEVIFHAAAHKHVPLMEANITEAVKTNVLGTRSLADLADEFGVRTFVFISTDKAVHPSSVMGATKNIAERYVHALSQESATRFTVVRFGNVLGSEGSVVPIFQEQIRRGGPITVTDPRMRRFFMTIPEATQLVLQAGGMGAGGEIFVLEMGEPVRIVDLARDLIRLSGLPEDSIEICFSGVRPGEKLFEELYFDDEQTLPTSHPKLRAAYARPYSLSSIHRLVSELAQAIGESEPVVRRKLHEIVPEYVQPNHAVVEPEVGLLTETDGARPHS